MGRLPERIAIDALRPPARRPRLEYCGISHGRVLAPSDNLQMDQALSLGELPRRKRLYQDTARLFALLEQAGCHTTSVSKNCHGRGERCSASATQPCVGY